MNSTTTTNAAFLADIISRPDDDTLRLIYADWLDEQGETARAEFIRLPINLETDPRWHGAGCSWENPCANCLREAQLFSADWLPLLDGSLRQWHFFNKISDPLERACRYYIRRGFVSEVRCSCADWMRHGPEIAKAHPLERVRLTDKKPRDDTRDYGEWDWFLLWPEITYIEPHYIPQVLMEVMVEMKHKLPGVKRVDNTVAPIAFISFNSPDNANAALSIACIEWARRQS